MSKTYDVVDAEVLHTKPVETRRKFSPVELMAIGLRGVFWGVTHPGKTLFLTLGAFGGACILVFGAGFALNILSGGNSPVVRGLNPWSVGDAAADAVSPVIDTGREAVVQTVSNTAEIVDPYAESFGTTPVREDR